MRKTLFSVTVFLFILCIAGAAQAAPQIILDDKAIVFDVPPIIENDRTLVPLRAIFEALGANVIWDDPTQTVTATKEGTEIKLTIGGQTYKNGTPVTLDVPAKIINDRTMVPLRFVSEALGAKVNWNGETETIYITSPSTTVPSTTVPSTTVPDTASPGTITTVHFIDVGQGDAIYCQLPGHNDILIDAGDRTHGATVVNYLKNQGVDDLELVIATHPADDHIGGLPAVFNAFQVKRVIDSGKVTDTDAYKEYAQSVADEGAIWEKAMGQKITFGNDTLQIISSAGREWENINDYSVVCRLVAGDIKFLFTGDIEGPAESLTAVNTGNSDTINTNSIDTIDADVLKVSNHGSDSSTSQRFLNRVNPKYAVISVGAENSYGGPPASTIDKLKDARAEILRTDLSGNIIFQTNGKSLSCNKSQITGFEAPYSIPSSVTTPIITGQYVGSKKTGKYHYQTCRDAQKMSTDDMVWFKTEEEAKDALFRPCTVCFP